MNLNQAVIPHIIEQHAEEAAFLWLLRHNAISAPHYSLKDLAKLDNRVEAHIDGLRIAGDYGWECCYANLEHKEPGEIFAAGLLALEGSDIDRINQVYAIVEENPETMSGLISAFGWIEPRLLQGKVSGLLNSNPPLWRRAGIAVCAIHRVDPGKYLDDAVLDEDIDLKTRALRACGELGRIDLKQNLLNNLGDINKEVVFWSAWSALLLGARGNALSSLRNIIIEGSDYSLKAIQILFKVLGLNDVKDIMTVLARHEKRQRDVIYGAGQSGDPSYIPWLIKQMETPGLAKLAGEACSLITGVDIAYDDLEGKLPKGFSTGPTENPEDEDVAMDLDEDLPVPNPALISGWWEKNQQNFSSGQRYLLGKPISKQHCQTILKTAKQRQRIEAALELALMEPNTPLFETRAVGKRQQ